ncbi:MAG: SDR family NAD(P)-dependent oxidoreductase [Acidobacteriota bacterium]
MLVGRSSEKLISRVERLGAQGNVATFVADAADAEAASVTATVEAFGNVDILLANAGTEGSFAPIESLTADEFSFCTGGIHMADGGFTAA